MSSCWPKATAPGFEARDSEQVELPAGSTLGAVRLDDNHVLDPDRTGVLCRLVGRDDAAILVNQDRAPGTELTE
jgi:hypothetical protein